MSYVTLSDGSAYRVDRIVALQGVKESSGGGWAICVDLGSETTRQKLPTDEDVTLVRAAFEGHNNDA